MRNTFKKSIEYTANIFFEKYTEYALSRVFTKIINIKVMHFDQLYLTVLQFKYTLNIT